ncbi:MAG TPA: 5-oxoprolinase subunit PxpA [Devosiaceae bacterium]
MSIWIDLNADLGEGMPADAEMLTIVSSASVACGGHAGDASTMRATLLAARDHGVTVGAHPGFADKASFGRTRLDLPIAEICEQVRTQLNDLLEIAAQVGVRIAYLKLHGALANMAAEDAALSLALFECAMHIDSSMAILALDNSAQVSAAEALGMTVIREAYADRRYTRGGLLVPRSQPNAVLTNPEDAVTQVVRLAKLGEIVAEDGTVLRSAARSVCVHGDTPGAVELARRVRAALQAEGITIASAIQTG